VPVDGRAFGKAVADRAADGMKLSLMADAGHRAAGFRQRRNFLPGVRGRIEHKTFVMRRVVLADETADRIELAVEHGDADVVCTPWEGGRVDPFIGGLIINVMVVAIDTLFAITADQMKLALIFGGPGHFTAR
jgi:hypothetical protein